MFSPSRLVANTRTRATGGLDRHHQRSHGTQEVLAVVEHHEQLLVTQVPDQRFLQTEARVRLHAEHSGDGVDDVVGVAHRRKLTQPRSVAKAWKHLCRNLEREPRLADATHARERHHPRSFERLADPLELALVPHERARSHRKVSGKRVDRPQPREVAWEIRVHYLEQQLRTAEVAQPMLTQLDEFAPCRQHVADELFRRVRHEDLAAVAHAHESRGAVQCRPVVVTVTVLRLTGVHAHPRR